MDVFLVPVAADRHQLYCEVPDEPPDAEVEVPRGFFRRQAHWLKHGFRQMLAEAEHERRHGRAARPRSGWLAKARARAMRWVAEAIAEQRLLWHMRKQAAATLFYPDDTTEADAVQALRKEMAADFDRHRFWLIVDSLGFIASGLLFLVPGPNLVAYYFAFRMVGHYLSIRGARQALDVVTWTQVPSPALTGVRSALPLEGHARSERIEQLAAELRLEHLARFVERTATV